MKLQGAVGRNEWPDTSGNKGGTAGDTRPFEGRVFLFEVNDGAEGIAHFVGATRRVALGWGTDSQVRLHEDRGAQRDE